MTKVMEIITRYKKDVCSAKWPDSNPNRVVRSKECRIVDNEHAKKLVNHGLTGRLLSCLREHRDKAFSRPKSHNPAGLECLHRGEGEREGEKEGGEKGEWQSFCLSFSQSCSTYLTGK